MPDPLRYVVLRHTGHPHERDHFDLMLETAPGSALATWRAPAWPITGPTALERLPDHRREYLEYEGPVSGDRGRVGRVAAGTFTFATRTAERWAVVLDSVAPLLLQCGAVPAWIATPGAPRHSGDRMLHIAGIDIGGTTVKMALVRVDGPGAPGAAAGGGASAAGGYRILRTDVVETLARGPAAGTVRRIADGVRSLMSAEGIAVLDGAGIGCPGLIDNVNGVVVAAANLPNFKAFPLGPSLAAELGCPAAVQNDANAAALGEFHFGVSARGCRNLVLLTLGTGVGGGVICDGRLLVGADNAAAELGHVKVDFGPAAAPCACGRRGCLEAYLGIAGIGRLAAEVLATEPGSPLAARGGEPLTTRRITEAAAAGDPAARTILHRAGVYLGRGVANFVEIFNPEKVVVAGGASRAMPFLLPGVREATVEHCSYAATRDRAVVEASALPDDINVLGAAAVFLSTRAPAQA